MFVGFTPGVAAVERSFLNPKFAKIFKLGQANFLGKEGAFQLQGRSIMQGLSRAGYAVFGTGGVRWFDPSTETGKLLSLDFDKFFYTGDTHSLTRQVRWIEQKLAECEGQPVFAFLNVGETHVPYYFEGAPWSVDDNPCVPFQKLDRAAECRARQTACLEYIDRELHDLLPAFCDSTIIVCADHGDCWGEDGIWEHGVAHEMTLSVPLMIRLSGRPIE